MEDKSFLHISNSDRGRRRRNSEMPKSVATVRRATNTNDPQDDGGRLTVAAATAVTVGAKNSSPCTTRRKSNRISIRCNLFVILSLGYICSISSILFYAQQTNAAARAQPATIVARKNNLSTSHAKVGKQIKRRSSSDQLPDSIYKMAPLLFGADIIQDYFTEPNTQQHQRPAKMTAKKQTARQQLDQLDYDSLQSESKQAPTIQSTARIAATANRKLQQQPRQSSAPNKRPAKAGSATTTKGPRAIGKQNLQRQMSKLAAAAAMSKQQQQAQRKTSPKRLQPATINTSRFTSSLVDTIDASGSEEVLSKTSSPTSGMSDAPAGDGPVDVEDKSVANSMGSMVDAGIESLNMNEDSQAGSYDAVTMTQDMGESSSKVEPASSKSSSTMVDQQAGAGPTSAPTAVAASGNNNNLPSQMSSLLRDVTQQQQQSNQPVSMDQVLSSLGLVVEAMKQQTMAMQMISGQMASDKLTQGNKQTSASLTPGSAGTSSDGSALQMVTNGDQLNSITALLDQKLNAAQNLSSPLAATSSSSTTTNKDNQQTTTTQVLSNASQAEARALLESFGELMSGFRGARAAKQFVLDSLGDPMPLTVIQSGGTKGGVGPGELRMSIEGTKGGASVVTTDNNTSDQGTKTSTATAEIVTPIPVTSSTSPATTTTTTTTTTTPKPTTTSTTTTTTTTQAPTSTTTTTTTTTPAPRPTTEAIYAATTEGIETIPPIVLQMIAKQKKTATSPQPTDEMPSMKSASLNYGGSGSNDNNGANEGLLKNGWRMVKPFDYYPVQTPMETVSNSMGGSHDDKKSVSLTYSNAPMGGHQNLNDFKTDNGNYASGQSHPQMDQMAPLAMMMMMKQQQHNGAGGVYPDPMMMVHPTMMQNQHSSMYNGGAQQLMQLPLMMTQHLQQQQQPQQQQPTSEPMMTSPYKQQQQQAQQQPKMMANLMAAAVAAAAAAEQQRALQQTMHSMQQQQQQQNQDQMSLSDEVPRVPNDNKRPQFESTSKPSMSDQQMQQQASLMAAQMMAAMSAGGSSSKNGQQLKIGERPPFDMSNFQLISPVEAGKQKNQQQMMAALMQSAVKELASVQQQQQQQQQSASTSSKQKSSTDTSSPASNDLSENASEVKSSTSNKDQGYSSGDDQSESDKPTQKRHPQQLVAKRPPQQPVTSTKVTSFSILGGRFKLTPHTQMLHAILEPSKQLIKHALSDLISPQPPPLPVNQPRRKQKPRQQAKSSSSGSATSSSSSQQAKSTSKSASKPVYKSASSSRSSDNNQSVKRVQKANA